MKDIYADKYLQLGLKIAYYRKLRGLTQEILAEQIGVSAYIVANRVDSKCHSWKIL